MRLKKEVGFSFFEKKKKAKRKIGQYRTRKRTLWVGVDIGQNKHE
jgi:hypothetical protein